METDTGQRRAKAGGEYGANGEWYEGGKFIATVEHTVKRAPMVHEVSPEELARRAARDAEAHARGEAIRAWVEVRRAKFAYLIRQLTRNPGHDPKWWAELMANNQAGFHASLGQQLDRCGQLSPRQAEFVAKFVFGRVNKRNGDAWDALVAELSEECP